MFLKAGGTIYSFYSMEPLKNLGLDHKKAAELAMTLHAHSVR